MRIFKNYKKKEIKTPKDNLSNLKTNCLFLCEVTVGKFSEKQKLKIRIDIREKSNEYQAYNKKHSNTNSCDITILIIYKYLLDCFNEIAYNTNKEELTLNKDILNKSRWGISNKLKSDMDLRMSQYISSIRPPIEFL